MRRIPFVLRNASLRNLRSNVWLLLLLLVVAGCAAPPQRTEPTAPAQVSFADQLFADARYREAADAFLDEVTRGRRDANDGRMRAAQSFLRAGLPGLAERQLNLIRRVRGTERDVMLFLREAAALDRNRSENFEDLEAIDPEKLPAVFRPDYWQWRARGEALVGDYQQAARALLERQALLSNSRDLADNQREILKMILRLPADQAADAAQAGLPGDALTPWLAVGAAVKGALLSGTPVERALDEWRVQYPEHPAGALVALETGLTGEDLEDQAGPVAVLVPMTGPLQFAGTAIRDGLISAWLATPTPRPELQWFDTAANAGRAIDAFNVAVERGASFVIGPLDRGAFRAVALEAQNYNVPVVGLNTLEWSRMGTENEPEPGDSAEDAPDAESAQPVAMEPQPSPPPEIDAPVFQFGLNPEDDARAAATMMFEHGHRRALTLVSADPWGERLAQAFTIEFERAGGIVIDAGTYDAAGSDHAAPLRRLLGLDASATRHRALSRLLNAELGFEPNRRGDADALFLGARVRQARLIKPQLRFHHAVDLPVYATSHVFDGVGNASIDRDLEGVFFADAPWLLNARGYEPTLRQATSAGLQSKGGAARLFALGMDSWRILPYLSWLGFSEESYPGATGDLSVRRDGEIRRMPTPAQFRRGTPRVVERAEASTP